MRFIEVVQKCKGERVIVNGADERLLVDVDEDFLVLQGGNQQVRIMEFVSVAHVVRLTRLESNAGSTIGLDIAVSVTDQQRYAPR
ncbi:MAG: hypothetical protein ACK47B_27710 [Armatimonadota bacterium]